MTGQSSSAAGEGAETVLGHSIVGTWEDEAHGGRFTPQVMVPATKGEERIDAGAVRR